MKILIVYFSATGNTKKMAGAIGEAFTAKGCDVTLSDITPYADRQKATDLSPYEAVVFGAPIHIMRAPRLVREWMKTLDGGGRKCAMFFTYGGFGVHPAHYTTRRILDDRNFSVVSSAEFLGFHTFNLGGWKAMEGRPDASDFELAKEFAEATFRRFTGEDAGILGELEKTQFTEEQLDSLEPFRFKALTQLPSRGGQDCCMCMVCQDLCPSGAMSAESGEADAEKCIACLACVAGCPEDALKINDMTGSWTAKMVNEKIDPEILKGKKGKIYI